jgi:protein-S-isoprenylcysteine O-methyltransferase Ste14
VRNAIREDVLYFAFPAVLFFFAGLAVSSIEERMLTEEFGDAYRMYMDATSKLIPFIY